MSRPEWHVISTSHIGTKAVNDDFAWAEVLHGYRRKYAGLFVCDGVGSRKGSGKCANTVGQVTRDYLAAYVGRRKRGPLTATEAQRLQRELSAHIPRTLPGSGSLESSDAELATTLAATIVDGDSLLALWAGDSRVFVLDERGVLTQVTDDHTDAEGRLTCWISGDGEIAGKISAVHHRAVARPAAVCVTTDGVHDRCRHDELRQFLLYAVLIGPADAGHLQMDLAAFLNGNVSDNFSLTLWSTSRGRRRLSSLGRNLFCA